MSATGLASYRDTSWSYMLYRISNAVNLSKLITFIEWPCDSHFALPKSPPTVQNCAKRLVILTRLIRSEIVPSLEYDTESDNGTAVSRRPGR